MGSDIPGDKLNPSGRLGKVFTDGTEDEQDEHLHIVVQRPPTGERESYSALIALPDLQQLRSRVFLAHLSSIV